jgi:hypothetical protein
MANDTPTLKATMAVGTEDFRRAVRAVKPHAARVKTGDDQSENRLRLMFAEGWLWVLASNSNAATTALGIVQIVSDSRTEGIGTIDGPMIADIQVRQAGLILQQFASKPADQQNQQLIEFELDLAEQWIQLLDIGGLWSQGETQRLPLLDFADNFPDVLKITSMALAGVGATTVAKPIVTDSRLLAQFGAAGVAYGCPVQVDGTGQAAQRGFLVTVGSQFLGTVESRHGDDDSLGRRDQARTAWLKRLPMRKLATA